MPQIPSAQLIDVHKFSKLNDAVNMTIDIDGN